jgi:hypothetical protein
MWLCTTRGFYSVVRKGTPPNIFQVRARTRNDIQNLCDLISIPYSRIVVSHDSDYEFRVKLSQSELGLMGAKLLDTIRYENFKMACGRRPDQQKQCDTYHKWWSDHSKWQEHPPYSGLRNRISDDDIPLSETSDGSASTNPEPPASDVIRRKRGNGRMPEREEQRPLDL